jgi:uncharacterized protein
MFKAVRRIALATSLFLSASSAHAQGPSFDCARATAQVEKLICGSPEISALDLELAKDLREVKAQEGIDRSALVEGQRQWLRAVRDRCDDVDCLRHVYAAREKDLLDMSMHAAATSAPSSK